MPDSTTTESPEPTARKQPAKGWLDYLARAKRIRELMPTPLKRLGRRLINREAYYSRLWALRNEFADAEEVSTYPSKLDVRLGIIKEFTHLHHHYIAACRDLCVPYRMVDISRPDWIDVVENSGCDAFLVRPASTLTIWKQMFDERLRVIVHQLGKIIYPSLEEIWVYESKRRMHYWLRANGVPHPQTWVFYSRAEALDFARRVELPIVYKSDLGAASSGVRIFRQRAALMRFISRCFEKGIRRGDADPRDRQWGSVLLQEYIPDAREWRMVRVGDSYFGYEKLKVGDFHSGSHSKRYSRPPEDLLDLLKKTTDKGHLTSMALDILVSQEGRPYVTELQTVFDMYVPYQLCIIDDQPGRMRYDTETSSWRFEPGQFCGNCMCNQRIEILLQMLGKRLPSQ